MLSLRGAGIAASAVAGALAVAALARYPGQPPVYVLFTLLSLGLFYFGFRAKAMLFDAFIAVFLLLGFWLKLSVRVAFLEGTFYEQPGIYFDASGAAFDRALLVACSGFAGLMVASYLRGKFLFNYPSVAPEPARGGVFAFYEKHRKAIWTAFALLVVGVAAANALLGIYQRGMVARTTLPFGLNAIVSWLLLFGLASISALILHCETMRRKAASYGAMLLSLAEAFFSNASLLSRGMILNAGALAFGLMKCLKANRIHSSARFWLTTALAFIVLFALSLAIVGYHRAAFSPQTPAGSASVEAVADKRLAISRASNDTKALFLDRWVGIEGVMAVSSHPALGWGLWQQAWQERPSPKLSFYDEHFIASPYTDADFSKHNYISLPGIVAFCFYPGSFLFLFACMLALGLLAAGIEVSVYKLGGGNLVLCALLAQVLASRYAHFGYAPSQTYLLFGALYFNVLLIYFLDWAALSRQGGPAR